MYVAFDEQQFTKVLIAALFTVYMQEQFVFIHDAVLEYLICGDTQIPTPDLNEALHCLQQCDERKQNTGFGIQFQVSKPSLHVNYYCVDACFNYLDIPGFGTSFSKT